MLMIKGLSAAFDKCSFNGALKLCDSFALLKL